MDEFADEVLLIDGRTSIHVDISAVGAFHFPRLSLIRVMGTVAEKVRLFVGYIIE